MLGANLYYAIVTCVAASLPRERVCSEAVLSCVLARSGKGRRVNSTAKAIIYNAYKYFERENAKSKNRGPPKLTHKTVKANGYSERRVRRDVADKSEIRGTTFTSPAKRYKIDRRGSSYWVISTWKHCDDLCTISTRRSSHTGYCGIRYCVSGIEGERHI